MRFASSITETSDTDKAIQELLAPIDARVTRGMVDLALLFSSAHFEDDLPQVVEAICEAFPTAVVSGCTAAGTIGCGRELEGVPSMSLLVGCLPDVTVRPFHIQQKQLESVATVFDWERIAGVSPESRPVFLAFGDPFSVDIAKFVDQINTMFPAAPLIGGVASAGHAPGENRLIGAGEIHREGIVGVALTGKLTVNTVVSQGCRPIGQHFVITKGEQNAIFELGGLAALAQLHNVLVGLSEREEKLARKSLLLGRVIDERKETFSRGDFLIQNILGVDRKSGAIGITGQARVGATVQFHVRDAETADEDLRTLLAPYSDKKVHGAMIFGCNGRGTQMWPKPGHDAQVVRELIGEIPTGGFFCGGEFGPVGSRNYIHGFTASIALLGDASE